MFPGSLAPGAEKGRSADVLWLFQVNEGDLPSKGSLLSLSIPGWSCTSAAERSTWRPLLAPSPLLEKLSQVAFMSANPHGEEMQAPPPIAFGVCIFLQWNTLVCYMLLYRKPPPLPTFAFHVPGTDIRHNV